MQGKRKRLAQSTAGGHAGARTWENGTVTGRRGTVKPWVIGVSAALTSRIAVWVEARAA